MARKMLEAPSHVWRAVVVIRFPNGSEHTEYQGPYWRKRDAVARITAARTAYRPEWSAQFVSGEIESAPLGVWEKVED